MMIYTLNRSRVLPIILLLAFLFIPFYCCLAQLSPKNKDNQEIIRLERAIVKKVKDQRKALLLLVMGLTGFTLYLRYKASQKVDALVSQMADQKKAIKLLLNDTQQERLRIANDIHNNIGQVLSAAKMNLSNLVSDGQNDALDRTLNLIDQGVNELRNISQQLIPEGLNFGVFNAIEELCFKINQEGVVNVELQLPDQSVYYQFEKSRALSIYELVEEILMDRIKYAGAGKINLTLHQDKMNLMIELEDNGEQFDVDLVQEQKKISWTNILLRIDLLDGKLQTQSKKLKANHLQVTLPNHVSHN